ncbi:MAG: Ig-like domain-containing protein [Alphaproteobacteria bacterium]
MKSIQRPTIKTETDMGRVFPREGPQGEDLNLGAPASAASANGHADASANGHANGHGKPPPLAASAVVRPVPGGEHKGMLELIAFTQPANGTTTRNADQTLAYHPKPGFTGEDSFEYTLRDEAGSEFSATVTVAVSLDAPARKPASARTSMLRALGGAPASPSSHPPDQAPNSTPPRAGE